MEDFAITIPLHYLAKKTTFSKYCAYRYYRHNNTITSPTKNYKKLKKMIDSYNHNLEYLISYLNQENILEKFKNEKIIAESFFRYFIIVFFTAFYKDVISKNIGEMKDTMIKFFKLVDFFDPEMGTNRLKNWTHGSHNLYRFSARINYFIIRKQIKKLEIKN